MEIKLKFNLLEEKNKKFCDWKLGEILKKIEVSQLQYIQKLGYKFSYNNKQRISLYLYF